MRAARRFLVAIAVILPSWGPALAGGFILPEGAALSAWAPSFNPAPRELMSDVQSLMRTSEGLAFISRAPALGDLLHLVPESKFDRAVFGAMSAFPVGFGERLKNAMISRETVPRELAELVDLVAAAHR